MVETWNNRNMEKELFQIHDNEYYRKKLRQYSRLLTAVLFVGEVSAVVAFITDEILLDTFPVMTGPQSRVATHRGRRPRAGARLVPLVGVVGAVEVAVTLLGE